MSTFYFQEEYAALGLKALKEDVLDRALNMNIEYRVGGVPYISLSDTNKVKQL